jgi:hypothetical protein
MTKNNNLPIPKDLFIECIETLKEQRDDENKFTEGLNRLCDGSPIMINKTAGMLIALLEFIFKDRDENISRRLYEKVDRVITCKDGREVILDTVEQLYDFLMENFNNNIGVKNETK